MEVKIISKETIKPSSPTPSHLRKFKLSSLDYLAPNMYVPMIFFYSEDDDDDSGRVEIFEKLNSLKNSLSETLTRFYPLAGRIMRKDVVECNDEGVTFYDARVDGQLAEVFRQVDGEKLKPLIPSDYYGARSIKDVLLAVQVNIFECGGMAISVCGSHKIIDGSTKAAFLNAWAATARGRGSSSSIHPTFDSASLFPIEDVLALEPWELLTKEKIVTKSFVFDESKIDILRGKDPKGVSVAYPTRVESISAFIWRCAMRAQAVAVGGSCRPSVAIHAVNVRSKTVPPLPEYSFGNLFGFGVAHWDGESERSEDMQRCLEGRLRKALRMFDGDYVKKMRGQYEHLRGDVVEAISKRDVDLFIFTSWCKFPFYDLDFGWGKPIWVSPSWVPIKNSFILMGRKWGDGMEVWANMAEEDMTKFEQDEELLAFASSRALA